MATAFESVCSISNIKETGVSVPLRMVGPNMSLCEMVWTMGELHGLLALRDPEACYRQPPCGASEMELDRLRSFLCEPIDASYEEFLRICNGWRQTEPAWSYLSIDDLIEGGREPMREAVNWQREMLKDVHGIDDGGSRIFPEGEVMFDWGSLLPVAYEPDTFCVRFLCVGNQPLKGSVFQMLHDDMGILGGFDAMLRSDIESLEKYLC